MSFNRIQVMGNLTRDPETRQLSEGNSVTELNIAVNQKSRGEETVQFFRASVFGKQGAAAQQYLSKGLPVYVVGELKVDQFTRKDGTAGVGLNVRVNDLQFVGGGSKKEEAPKAAAAAAGAEPPLTDEDIPF